MRPLDRPLNLSPRALNPAETAEVDQWLTALHDGEDRWPHNGGVESDPRMERLLLAGLGGPSPTEGWESLHPGGVWLVWPSSGAVVPCPPGTDIASIASESHPTGVHPCERCGSESPTFGAVVLSSGAVLVGVLLCGGCAADLEINHGPVLWVHARKAS